MSDRTSFYVSILIAGTIISGWIILAICFEGHIPFFSCPLKYFFDIQCPFCKLTRACAWLFKGNIQSALQTTPLIAVLPFMAIFPLSIYDTYMNKSTVYSIYVKVISNKIINKIIRLVALITILSIWILNLN